MTKKAGLLVPVVPQPGNSRRRMFILQLCGASLTTFVSTTLTLGSELSSLVPGIEVSLPPVPSNSVLALRFSRDMLPYWYKQMIENQQGRTFQRGKGGENLIYKHEKFFVIGNFENGYHPIINIRLRIFLKYLTYFSLLSILA